MTRAKFKRRLLIVVSFFLLIILVFVARLYFLQIINGERYRDKAEFQYTANTTPIFDRGDIFFTDKNGDKVVAATLDSGFTIAVVPKEVSDPEALYDELSKYITLDKDTVLYRAGKQNDPYEELAKRVPTDVGVKIQEADIPGIRVVRDRWRTYPGGSIASQTIGILGYQGHELVGKYGLERYYDSVLSRKDSSLYENFFAEVFANLGTVVFNRDTEREGNIVTSIDPSVETYLEERLKKTLEDTGSTMVGGIIMNPKDGSIYAMASYPTFDPNNLENLKDPGVLNNPLVENVYEFGSIIKPLTIAAGIDSGAIKPDSTYYDVGTMIVDGKRVSNFDGRGRGEIPIQQILSQSLNTGSAYVMLQMGRDTFRKYFKNLKLGEETGIDLPGEVHGLVSNLDSPRDVEYVTASFGQGIAMTPIETIRALSSIANQGALTQPHIATEIFHPHGLSKKLGWGLPVQVFKPESAEDVTRMMVTAVDTALLDGTVSVPEMSIAAKTGTAQMASPEGGYYKDKSLHSFFGFFPAYDPKFSILLFAIDPKSATYSSHTLTHPFMDIVAYLTNYYQVPPDRLNDEKDS